MNARALLAASAASFIAFSLMAAEQGARPGSVVSAPPSAIALDLSTPRATHAGVELSDGRILLIGGCAAANCDEGPGSATVDLFEPGTRRIVPAGTLVQPRVQPAAVRLPDDRVLILGGWSQGKVTPAAEIFDPKTRRSKTVQRMSQARASVAAISLRSGQVLVVGGSDGQRESATAELFDPATERFTETGRLNQPRAGVVLASLPDGKVLITGGITRGTVTAAAELFDPATKRFSPAGSMLEARYKHAAVTLRDGRVLVIGGSDERDYSGKKQSLEMYDPRTGCFTSAGNLRTARFKITHSVALLEDGRVLIAGGAPRIEVYDPDQGTVRELDFDLGGSWSYMSANRVGRDQVLVAGGYSEGSIRVTQRARLIGVH